MCRVLRIRQSKLDKGRSGGGGRGGAAGITLDELRADFPLSTMSDAVLQNRLRERCGCQPRGVCCGYQNHPPLKIMLHCILCNRVVNPYSQPYTLIPPLHSP